jgi:hypothetical protein
LGRSRELERLGNQRGEDAGELELAENDGTLGCMEGGSSGEVHESTIIGDGERLANNERLPPTLGLMCLYAGVFE